MKRLREAPNPINERGGSQKATFRTLFSRIRILFTKVSPHLLYFKVHYIESLKIPSIRSGRLESTHERQRFDDTDGSAQLSPVWAALSNPNRLSRLIHVQITIQKHYEPLPSVRSRIVSEWGRGLFKARVGSVSIKVQVQRNAGAYDAG